MPVVVVAGGLVAVWVVDGLVWVGDALGWVVVPEALLAWCAAVG